MPTWGFDDLPIPTSSSATLAPTAKAGDEVPKRSSTKNMNYVPSPIQITKIRDLAPQQNVDTVGLDEILGDPMIKECWNFNYLFDLEFVMYVLT